MCPENYAPTDALSKRGWLVSLGWRHSPLFARINESHCGTARGEGKPRFACVLVFEARSQAKLHRDRSSSMEMDPKHHGGSGLKRRFNDQDENKRLGFFLGPTYSHLKCGCEGGLHKAFT